MLYSVPVLSWCTKGLRNYFNMFLAGRRPRLIAFPQDMRARSKREQDAWRGRRGRRQARQLPAWQSSNHAALAPLIPHHSLHLHCLITRACFAGGVQPAWLVRANSKSPPHSPFLPSPSFCGGEDSTGGGQEGASGGAAKTERARRRARDLKQLSDTGLQACEEGILW